MDKRELSTKLIRTRPWAKDVNSYKYAGDNWRELLTLDWHAATIGGLFFIFNPKAPYEEVQVHQIVNDELRQILADNNYEAFDIDENSGIKIYK